MKCPHCNKYFCKRMDNYADYLKKIINLHNQGLSLKNIAFELDEKVSIGTINKYVNAYELAVTLGLTELGKSL